MKRSLAFFMLSTCAAAASAQSSVTISGVIGLGIANVGGASAGNSDYKAGNVIKMDQDSKTPSRIAFRGVEDLGDDMAALFVLDKGFTGDDGAQTLSGAFRESYVGLRGSFGTVTLGRQFHPLYNTRDDFDPTADSSNLMATAGFRMNNSIMYLTPKFGGFFAKLAYGFGEVAGDTSAGRAVGGYLGYSGGPFAAKLGYNNLKATTGSGAAKNTLLAASYNFGMATGFLGYGINKGLVTNGIYSALDTTDALIGVRVPIGKNTLAATYIRKNDKIGSADANQIQLFYAYSLSKRTTLYGVFTKISNKGDARYTTAHAPEAPTLAQFANGARAYDREFSVGLRHSF